MTEAKIFVFGNTSTDSAVALVKACMTLTLQE